MNDLTLAEVRLQRCKRFKIYHQPCSRNEPLVHILSASLSPCCTPFPSPEGLGCLGWASCWGDRGAASRRELKASVPKCLPSLATCLHFELVPCIWKLLKAYTLLGGSVRCTVKPKIVSIFSEAFYTPLWSIKGSGESSVPVNPPSARHFQTSLGLKPHPLFFCLKPTPALHKTRFAELLPAQDSLPLPIPEKFPYSKTL